MLFGRVLRLLASVWLLCIPISYSTALAQTSAPDFSEKDLQNLLIRMQANRKSNGLLQQQYTSEEFWHNRNFDKNGKLKLDETAKYENLVVEGLLYRRKIEHNGKPLSGKEAADEQARYDKAVAERREMTAAQKRLSLHRTYHATLPLEYLDTLFENRVLRHEQLNGRDTLVVESLPKAGVKPNSDAEKSSLNWKEVTWIDLAETMPVRFEAESLADIKNFQKGQAIKMGFTRIEDRISSDSRSAKPVWLVSSARFNGRFKMLWIEIAGITEQTWTNYKRFRVDLRLLDDSVEEVPASAFN